MNLRSSLLIVLVTCLGAAACGGGGGSSAPAATPGPSRTVSGTATYDFVPVSIASKLNFAGTTSLPIRNAVVQVARGATILGTGSTDAITGNYSVTYNDTGSGLATVNVIAKTTVPPIEVKDNTDGATWAVGSSIPATPAAITVNVHAAHGWTGLSYNPLLRAAAPFAILDSMLTAEKAFIAVRPLVNFPALVVNWSPNNVPSSAGTLAGGFIGTSHFNPGQGAPVGQIFILGKDGVDTDEFDAHVMVHEWGHYFEHNLSRSDSPGGPHGGGDILDPRLSFGEGWGNALSGMLLPDPVYVDTAWSGVTMTAFGFSTETDPGDVGGTTDDPSKGAFSESSVMRVLYDIFDPANEAWDGVVNSGLGASNGLGLIYDVLTGPQKTTDGLTTIGSFITGLKAQLGANTTVIDALLAHYLIGPITTQWGDGDVGGVFGGLRGIYIDVASFPAAKAITFNGGVPGSGFESNKWYQNQYYVVTGNGNQVTVTTASTLDVDLNVFQAGSVVAFAATNSGNETVHFPTIVGKKYVVSLVGFGTAASYNVTLNFTSP